jgi:hypothetical protein
MASPHVAGTVALIMSAAPSLIGDITGIRTLLDQTAIDTSDLSCGGTATNNNVWGEGRLDAFAAVDQSPRGPTGTLQGTVTDAATHNPIAGASVVVTGPSSRTDVTDATGAYSMPLPVGSYDVTVSSFGYADGSAVAVQVTENATTVQDFALVGAPSHRVAGFVRNAAGRPIANATVTIVGTPIAPATSNANGAYAFASVPDGTYDLTAQAGRCNTAQTQSLVVNGDELLNFALPQRADAFHYTCRVSTSPYIPASTVIPLTGDDATAAVTLPFAFHFYGQTYTTANVSTNGNLNFVSADTTYINSAIPSPGAPNAAVYVYWDDMLLDASSSVRTRLMGTAPNRRFVIEWRNMGYYADATRRVDAEAILYETGHVLTLYRNIAADPREEGNSATLGIENAAGTIGFQYSFNEAVIGTPTYGVLYVAPPAAAP